MSKKDKLYISQSEKERARPILMSAPMVRAILYGRKTMTRRAIKKQPVSGLDETFYRNGMLKCPYGLHGDRLWVRETFLPLAGGDLAIYRADYGPQEAAGLAGMYSDHGWKPSIFMPRKLSRSTLEIEFVTVERVQEITEEDVKREGVEADRSMVDGHAPVIYSYRDSFRRLWDSINGKKYPWSSNPFVWVLTFNVV